LAAIKFNLCSAKGGRRKVYLAEDISLRQQVALKVQPIEFPKEAERVHHFEHEARMASALNHPNIITIYEFGQNDQWHFIASEFIEGQTLRERMTASRLGVREAVNIAIQVASALEAAHIAGIIHCNIKPENVMVRPDGLVKVLDFGIAKPDKNRWHGGDHEQPSLTKPDIEVIMGTASYVSPEQALGQELDVRTDVFSLGVIIYEMVTGQLPFGGNTRAEVLQTLLSNDNLLSLDVLHDDEPSVLEKIIKKALRENREERYASASEMLDDLSKTLPAVKNMTPGGEM
jgi:eukaryotic-like serine/threonine-protein kinase